MEFYEGFYFLCLLRNAVIVVMIIIYHNQYFCPLWKILNSHSKLFENQS